MFRNYLVTALRNIARHKLYSFINIAGLAVGLACVIFVILFIRDELSYDKWIPDTQNLYRVEMTIHVPGRDPLLTWRSMPFPMPAAMRDEIPEVTGDDPASTTTIHDADGRRPAIPASRSTAVDPNFFRSSSCRWSQGDPARVFRDPQSLVLSESAARKYFGTTDAIGKIITTTANCEAADTACLGRMVSLKVTGIMRGYSPQFPARWRCVPAEHLDRGPQQSRAQSTAGIPRMVTAMSGWRRAPIRRRLSPRWRPCWIAPSRESSALPATRSEGQPGLYWST